MKLTFYNSWREWTLLAALALSSEYGAAQTAVLLRVASVSRGTIRLSDLLPPETSIKMRQASEQIELGATPQCHTIRYFEPSDIEKRTSSWPVLQGLSVSGPVSVQRACFPIRREAVQQAISEFARQKDAALAELPLHWSEVIYASQQNPALEVEQALPDPVRPALQIRLRCVQRAVCPSFLVSVPTALRLHRLSTSPISAAETAPQKTNGDMLVKSGQRVMLVFDDPPLRMQLLVTCLQSGILGEQVRAMDPVTRRVFRAEVTGAGTLMAHL
ncbi:MAG: flagella basal body P-ring formation protein FlgA [Terriglobales bacterium]